ncbi:MAG: HEAT repeat domain-containing protein, partial [Planctomycetaceae bacterium]
WSTALDAVMDDNHPEGDRLAIDAAHIEDPNVQMRALTYFARHPQSKFAGRILELMNGERSHAVRLAAIRAAGFCRHPSLEHGSAAEPPDGRGGQGIAARRGLKDWMLSPDQAIREAAALSLARFGSELGYQELYRRSFAPDPKQRVRAYRMMGETGQRRFVAHLIRRAGADGNTAARKAILNSLDELVPADEKPVGLSTATGYDNRIRVWSDWQKRRSNRKAPQPSQRPSTHPRATLPSGNHTSSGHSR